MMVVNLSPTMASCSESLCSLRFASTVSQVHLGTAKKHINKTGGAASGGDSVNTYSESDCGTPFSPADGGDDEDAGDDADAASSSAAPTAFRKRTLAQSGPSYMQQTARARTVTTGTAAGSVMGAGVGAGSGIPRMGTMTGGNGGSKKLTVSAITRK